MEAFYNYINHIGEFFVVHGWDFLAGLIVLIVGLILVKLISAIVRKIISKTKSDGAVASFIVSMIVAIVDIVIIIIALSIMGLNTASILTVVATGGVAIGLALKDSLGNIASGIIIIINKPFKKGDYIIVSGVEGKVNKINLFNTLLTTWDNKVVVVPNSVAVNNPIINCDTASTRRVDIEIGFDYGVDIEKAREIISKIVELDERASIEKPYQIVLSQFKESAVNMSVRVWTDTENYWGLKFDLQETIYKELYASGLTFAYNRMVVDTEEAGKIPARFKIVRREVTDEDKAKIDAKIEKINQAKEEKIAEKALKKTSKIKKIMDSDTSIDEQ